MSERPLEDAKQYEKGQGILKKEISEGTGEDKVCVWWEKRRVCISIYKMSRRRVNTDMENFAEMDKLAILSLK